MIYKRIIDNGDFRILILSDKDLYGKKFEEGEFILEINEFFVGEEIEKVNIKELYKYDVIYAVGEESINMLVDSGIIDKKDAKYIKGVPYVYILLR